MVTLRIQEVAQNKFLRLLSKVSGVTEPDIQQLAEKATEDFRKIATALDVSTDALPIQTLGKNQALRLLSKASGIAEETIQKYAEQPVEITEVADDLRKIADVLNVPVVELINPLNSQEAVKFKILEKARQKLLNSDEWIDDSELLEKIEKVSGIHVTFLVFFCTQSLKKEWLFNTEYIKIYINKICEVLQCSLEELQEPTELPLTKFDIESLLIERNITLNDLSILTDFPPDFIDLIATHPIDNSFFENELIQGRVCVWLCRLFGGCCNRIERNGW